MTCTVKIQRIGLTICISRMSSGQIMQLLIIVYTPSCKFNGIPTLLYEMDALQWFHDNGQLKHQSISFLAVQYKPSSLNLVPRSIIFQ
jgi:hypothetical protein